MSEARTWRGSERNTTPKVCGRLEVRNDKTEGGVLASEVSVLSFRQEASSHIPEWVEISERGWWGLDYFLAFHKVLRASMLDVWPASMIVRLKK